MNGFNRNLNDLNVERKPFGTDYGNVLARVKWRSRSIKVYIYIYIVSHDSLKRFESGCNVARVEARTTKRNFLSD